MSLDYPEYLELKKKSRWLALLWRIGDIGYYLGVLGAAITPLVLLALRLATVSGRSALGISWGATVLAMVLSFVGFALLWYVSASLKVYALRKGGVARPQGREGSDAPPGRP
jgi:hypothetical protein